MTPPAGGRSAALLSVAAGVGLLAVVAAAVALWPRGGDATADPGPVHVHALGVHPADGSLLVATHSGLYRLAPDEQEPRRVGELQQDTMGFTVVGRSRFLGSGHPDLQEARERGLPPHLGLIESRDAGRTWEPVSLLGEADFHSLRAVGSTIYGYDSSNDRLLRSGDGGLTWSERPRPGPILDLAVAPGRPDRLVAASLGGAGEGLFASRDGGKTWRRTGEEAGLLGWPSTGPLYLVTAAGEVLSSDDGGATFTHRGRIGAQPAAFVATSGTQLYAALHDGRIVQSRDGGATWLLRGRP